jgi:hypothetical protein
MIKMINQITEFAIGEKVIVYRGLSHKSSHQYKLEGVVVSNKNKRYVIHAFLNGTKIVIKARLSGVNKMKGEQNEVQSHMD